GADRVRHLGGLDEAAGGRMHPVRDPLSGSGRFVRTVSGDGGTRRARAETRAGPPSDQAPVTDLTIALVPSIRVDGNRPMSRSTRRYGRSGGSDPTSPTPSACRTQPSSSAINSIRRRSEPPSTAPARSSETAKARSSTWSGGAPRSFATPVANARSVTPMRGSVGTSRAAMLISRPLAKVVDGLDARDRRLEPGEVEELRHGRSIRRDEHQISSELPHVLQAGHDRSESTRVDEPHLGEIQGDLQRSVRVHLPNALAQPRSGRQIELAGNREHRPR